MRNLVVGFQANRRLKFTALFLVATSVVTSLSACEAFVNTAPKKSNSEIGPRATSEQNVFSAEDLQFDQGPFTERKMLINVGLNVIAPAVKAFAAEATMLSNRLDLACGDLQRGLDVSAWLEAIDQWKRTMVAFHKVDVTSMGPTQQQTPALYAWPFLNRCTVDLAVIAHAQSPVTGLSEQMPSNLRGLGAIEYLLTEPGLRSACNPRAQPLAAEWSGLAEPRKRLDRCRYARVLAQDVQIQSHRLREAWNPSQNNFTKSMVDGSAYADVTKATNAMTDSMFSIMSIKDQRLGRVLGLQKECEKAACPEFIEHRDTELALKAYAQRIRQFRDLFTGREGFGIDDLLMSRGHEDVARRFVELLDQVLLGLEAEAQSPWAARVEAQLASGADACRASTTINRRDSLCAVHADLREAATYFKIQVLSALALRQPPSYQGDND